MSKKAKLYFMYVLMFLFAFGFILYSALMPAIRDHYQLTLTQAGWVGAVLSAGQFVILFFNDLLVRRFSRNQLTLMCFIAYILSMVLICLAPPYWALLGAFFVIGMAINLVNVMMSAEISDLFGEERDRYLNYFHSIYGLGSMAGPLLPAVTVALNWHWTSSFVIVSVLCGVMLLSFLKVDLKSPPTSVQAEAQGSFSLLKSKPLLIISGAAFLYIGMDMTVCSWISGFLVDIWQMTESTAGLAVTLYWIGAALGRLAHPTLFGRVDVKKYLILANLLGAVIFGLCAAIGGSVLSWGLLVVGFATGSSFPLLIGMGCSLFPDNSGAATNVVVIAGSIGGAVFPWLSGVLNDVLSYTAGFVALNIGMLGGVAVLIAVLGAMKNKGKAGNNHA